jgi:hypothetical protein
MTLYQVRKIARIGGTPRYVVAAVDHDGTERMLLEFRSEAQAKASARAAVAWKDAVVAAWIEPWWIYITEYVSHKNTIDRSRDPLPTRTFKWSARHSRVADAPSASAKLCR